MITRAGDIYCEQGETFTLGFRIVNPGGSPFVIAKELDTPGNKSFILVTVASSSNITGKERYLANFWADTKKYKSFDRTQAIKMEAVNNDWPSAATVWNNVMGLKPVGYTGTWDPATLAIYYIVKNDGTRDYKQLTGTASGNAALEDYNFDFYMYFPKDITNEWAQSGYDFAIKLVAGNAAADATKLDKVDFSYPLHGAHKIYVDTNVQGSIDNVEVINE